MAINRLETIGSKNNQILEDAPRYSYMIPEGQRHLGAGKPVVISQAGGVAGVLITDICPADPAPRSVEELAKVPAWGHNGPHHATVAFKGVFELEVTVSASDAAGSPVYIAEAEGNTGDPTLTTTKGANEVILGTLFAKPTATSGKVKVGVVLNSRTV